MGGADDDDGGGFWGKRWFIDMEYAVEERFQIPYIRLKFILVLSEDSILPKEKVSALRGGMGEMLLRQNCIGMRDCKNCSFEEACIVRSTVYTRMKRKPAFMQGDDSIGYLLECENARTDFKAGEEKILENQTAHMKNYRIETVGAYLEKEF